MPIWPQKLHSSALESRSGMGVLQKNTFLLSSRACTQVDPRCVVAGICATATQRTCECARGSIDPFGDRRRAHCLYCTAARVRKFGFVGGEAADKGEPFVVAKRRRAKSVTSTRKHFSLSSVSTFTSAESRRESGYSPRQHLLLLMLAHFDRSRLTHGEDLSVDRALEVLVAIDIKRRVA